MPDNRFPSPGTDTRFPVPGEDTRFDGYPVDAQFPNPGEDGRFQDLSPLPVYGPFELAGYMPFFLRPKEPDWEIGYNIDPEPGPDLWSNFRQAMLDAQTDPAFRDYARFEAATRGWQE